MGAGEVKFTADMEGAAALKEVQRLSKELGKLEKSFDKLAKSSKKGTTEKIKLDKQAMELDRQRKRVLEQIITPQEKYNKKVKELNVLLRTGRLTQDQYSRAVRKTRDDLKGADRAGQSAFGTGALRRVGTYVAGLATIAQAVRLITDEFRLQVEVQKRAGQRSVTLADVQIAAFRNLGAETPEQRDIFTARIARISKEQRVTQIDLFARASAAITAAGALPQEFALQAVEQSARIVPESAQIGTAVAEAAIDIAKISGATDPRVPLGRLIAIGKRSRVTDIGALSTTLAPALTATVARGGTIRGGGALFAALGQAKADPSGRTTRTAQIALVESLQEFLPNLPTAQARIEFLQQNPQARAKFKKKFTFELAARAPIEQVLSGTGAGGEAFAKFVKEIPSKEEAVAAFENTVTIVRGGELQKTATFGRSLDVTQERLQTRDQPKARLGLLREKFGPILEDAGVGALASRLSNLRTLLGDDFDSFIAEAEARVFELRPGALRQRKGPSKGFFLDLFTAGVQTTVQSEDDKAVIVILTDLLDEMRALRADQRQLAP